MSQKKTLLTSYISGITDTSGERYVTIFSYLWPELITAFIVSSLLSIVNSIFIGHLHSTELFVAQGVATNFLNFIQKVAEGLSIGTVILCGQYNGAEDPKNAGRAATNSLWLAAAAGALIATTIFFGAQAIYTFYGVNQQILQTGIPFLRLRSGATFLSFIFFALIGFFRSLKNTKVPMICFIIGSTTFIIVDYICIFGAFGVRPMGLMGSAYASIAQYTIMIATACYYLVRSKISTIYQLSWKPHIQIQEINRLVQLSWPVMVDKATMAFTKIWMLRLFTKIGTPFAASYSAIQEMEMLAFIPAIAASQVITFLVSNDYGAQQWTNIKVNIKKTLFLASCMVFGILVFFSFKPEFFFNLFDTVGTFSFIASAAFPMVSVFVVFDIFQLILAGALRGAANVKTVMATRLAVCTLFLFPASYICASLPFQNLLLKFILIYGIAYVSDGIMGIIYILRFRSNTWKSSAKMKNIKGTYVTHYRNRDSASGKTRQPQA